MKKKYDAIVIGGGHNGLVNAAYLAKEGLDVAVFEKNSNLGGCSSTDETSWPGYKISTASYVLSLFTPGIINDLELKRHGLEIIPRRPSSYTPDLEGPGLVMGTLPSGENISYQEISRYSEHDAENFARYEGDLERVAKKIEPFIEMVPPNLSFRDFKENMARFGQTFKNLFSFGQDFEFACELMTGAATSILNQYFESDILKATLATDAIIGAMAAPSTKGSAYVLLHHVMGEAGGARGVWGYVRGGMGGLADSLKSCCKERGVDIFNEGYVRTVKTNEHGRVKGISFYNSSCPDLVELESSAVISSLSCESTFNYLVGRKNLPSRFLKSIDKIDYSSASAKINLALDQLPEFISGVDIERDFQILTGTTHIPNTMQDIENAFQDALQDKPSRKPILEMTIPSLLDSTVAPEGKHLMNIFVQYFPYNIDEIVGGKQTQKDVKEDFMDRCIDLINQHTKGDFASSVTNKQMLTPVDLEDKFSLTEGNLFQGAMKFPFQMSSFRPVAGYSDYRTPIKGLYMCGAATHPGGGVIGINGRNAAREVLRDLKKN